MTSYTIWARFRISDSDISWDQSEEFKSICDILLDRQLQCDAELVVRVPDGHRYIKLSEFRTDRDIFINEFRDIVYDTIEQIRAATRQNEYD